jgi:hypothetical protein
MSTMPFRVIVGGQSADSPSRRDPSAPRPIYLRPLPRIEGLDGGPGPRAA